MTDLNVACSVSDAPVAVIVGWRELDVESVGEKGADSIPALSNLQGKGTTGEVLRSA